MFLFNIFFGSNFPLQKSTQVQKDLMWGKAGENKRVSVLAARVAQSGKEATLC
jgi:hypothetical protein